VLKINLKQIEHAEKKIDRGEFAVEDSVTKKDIDLSMDWEACFAPGQHVEMSMIFIRSAPTGRSCPKCSTMSKVHSKNDIEW
jgi:hypothetical protein